jgi:hypothetical protein
MLVLEAVVEEGGGGGKGTHTQTHTHITEGRVKSNHHLTELARMTFMKKEPDVVQLYFRKGLVLPPVEEEGGSGAGTGTGTDTHIHTPTSGGSPRKDDLKRRAYRIARKEEFIKELQEKLQRFKE